MAALSRMLKLAATTSGILAGALLASQPARAQTADDTPGWYLGLGATLPFIDERAGDFPRGDTIRHETSSLTFPRLLLGWRTGRMAYELGYRKLGTLGYRDSLGTLDGETHSNALALSAVVPVASWRGVRLQAHLGIQAVRTIADWTATPDVPEALPFTGGVNHWQILPVTALGIGTHIARHWDARLSYEVLLGELGSAADTGRYRQQAVAVEFVYRR